MTLGDVLVAREAFRRLAAQRLPVKTAYTIMKYAKRAGAELETLEEQRVKLVLEAAGAEPGTQASLTPGTPEFESFALKYQELLMTPADLEPLSLTLDAILAALGDTAAMSAEDLAALEPLCSPPEETPSCPAG